MTVWEFFSNAPGIFWIIVGLLVAMFGILIFILLKTGMIKTKWFTAGNSSENSDPPESHKGCVLYHDYQTMRRNSETVAQAPFLLIRDQLYRVEDFQEAIVDRIQKHFLTLLKGYRGGEIVGLIHDPAYEDYQTAFYASMTRVKHKVRFFFQENHLAELTDPEFQEKMESHVEQIVKLFTKELNEWYPRSSDVPREKVYEHNLPLIPEISKMLRDMFVEGRRLAAENAKRIEELKNQELE